ncbi:Mechanosensitive ion channel-domain-containing protein [Gymnopilus junonius]|uniref:Mechanosensitive ion channel-domain-containing protein n=1 Tax=Gymnopilus junonius TaxID=109634 RepID=A0A9P5TNZ5_GYMJU|nr:Mechanosensitive ion channel-domain-containing protein [Gymnopilus junonius]
MATKEGQRAGTPPSEFQSAQNARNYEDNAEDFDSDTAGTRSSDEFDWFEDESRRLWLALMKLSRPIRVLLVSVLGAAIFVTPLIIVNIRFRESLVKTQVHVWSLWFTITWAAGCGTYLLVDATPRIVIIVTRLFGGQIERLKIQVELVMAVKAWLKLALDITWAWVALSVIRAVYRPFGTYWIVVNRVMQALFSAGIILFVEKLLLQFVAINFHQKALADRIAENQLGLKALDHLSNPYPYSPRKLPHTRKRGHKENGSIGTFDFQSSGTFDYRSLKKVETSTETSPGSGGETSPLNHPQGPSVKPNGRPRLKKRRRKMASVIVDQVGEAISHVAFRRPRAFGGVHSARRLARKLFSTLSDVSPPRSHLVVDDFYPYFRTAAEAHEAFALFDKDGNGDISKREMREAVQRIYRERKSLISGLKDVGSIVAKLDAVLLFTALIFFIFICLLIFNPSNTLASLVPLASMVLGFSFIFGHSAQILFESLIFIFSTHVFDVGDLVMIDDQVLFVKEFGLFSTTFRRVDGQEIIAPNSLLSSTKLVHNLRRSKSMWETTELTVSYNTPMNVIEQLRIKIVAYMNANSREWADCSLNIDKMEFQNAIHLIVGMEHRPSWQDWGGRWTRRTAFMRYLKTILEELDIRYTMPIQPVLLPSGDASYLPTHMQTPPQGAHDRVNPGVQGNAGFYQAGDYGRMTNPVFRTGVSSFK